MTSEELFEAARLKFRESIHVVQAERQELIQEQKKALRAFRKQQQRALEAFLREQEQDLRQIDKRLDDLQTVMRLRGLTPASDKKKAA